MRMIAASLLLLVAALAGCGEDDADRPALAAWSDDWTALRDMVPQDAAINENSTEVCGDFLGEVRNRRADVLPTPDVSLDEPVTDWVSQAETIGLDCDREGDLDDRIDDLSQRAEEIDARIDLLDE